MSKQRWCVCTHAESEHTAGFCGGSNGYRAGVYCSCTQFHDERTIATIFMDVLCACGHERRLHADGSGWCVRCDCERFETLLAKHQPATAQQPAPAEGR